MRQFIKDMLENPVLLRDIGWKYAPPFLGFIPRKYAQAGFILFIVGLIYYFFYYLYDNSSQFEDAIIAFGGLSLAAGICALGLSAVSSLRAWKNEREMNYLVDLIMTGMDLRTLAHGKILARGFPIFASTLFFCSNLFFFIIILNDLYSVINYNDPSRFDDREILTSLLLIIAMIVHLTAFIVYLDGMRISLLKKWVFFKLLKSILVLITYPLIWVVFIFILAFMIEQVINDRYHQYLFNYFFLYLVTVPLLSFIIHAMVQYRKLLHTVVYYFNRQLDE